MKRFILIGALALNLFCPPLSAADKDLKALFAERLRNVVPDAAVTSVKPAAISGLYEVMLGATVLYMSEDGRYVFRGDLFDLNSKANLTDARRIAARTAALSNLAAGSTIDCPTEVIRVWRFRLCIRRCQSWIGSSRARAATPSSTIFGFGKTDPGYARGRLAGKIGWEVR